MNSENGPGRGRLSRDRAYSTCSRARPRLQLGPSDKDRPATRRRPNPVEKRNTGDGPILSPCAAAGDVRAYVRTLS